MRVCLVRFGSLRSLVSDIEVVWFESVCGSFRFKFMCLFNSIRFDSMIGLVRLLQSLGCLFSPSPRPPQKAKRDLIMVYFQAPCPFANHPKCFFLKFLKKLKTSKNDMCEVSWLFGTFQGRFCCLSQNIWRSSVWVDSNLCSAVSWF